MGYKKSPTHCVPGGKWLGHRTDKSSPMQLYLCSPHIPSWCAHRHYLLLQLSAAMSSSLQIGPETHNEQLSTLLHAGTIWVIHVCPTSNNYHVTFMYKTCGKVNTQWSYSCPCAHHKGVWKTGRTAPLTSELNRGERSASLLGTEPQYSPYRTLGGPQSRSAHCRKSLAPTRNRTIPW